MNKTKFLTRQEGQTYTIVEVGKFGYASSRNLVVTNNGEVWSAVWDRIPAGMLGIGALSFDRGSVLTPEYRLPLVWARRAAKDKPDGEIVSTKAGTLSHSETRQYLLPPPYSGVYDSVTFTGFTPSYAKRSAHSLKDLTGIITDVVAVTMLEWDWKPNNLQVCFHDKSNAYGLAYNPGCRVHKISLNIKLLEAYDQGSVWRVIAHEFCHHYRNENFPIPRVMRGRRIVEEHHDEIFCAKLKLVDHTLAVKGGESCVKFVDAPDEALVVALKKKRDKHFVEPLWAPDAGHLSIYRLKSGQFRFAWEPNPPNQWTVRVSPVRDGTILALVKQFAPKDLVNVRVTGDKTWHTASPPHNLHELLGIFLRGWPQAFNQTSAYLMSVIQMIQGTPL